MRRNLAFSVSIVVLAQLQPGQAADKYEKIDDI